jgi:sporulation protein YlmC with PRC-barrel domain
MHTKNGRPLQISGKTIYSVSGQVVGRVREAKLFSEHGRYVATVVGDRLVYRAADSSKVAPSFNASRCSPRHLSVRPRSTVRGEEPVIPD